MSEETELLVTSVEKKYLGLTYTDLEEILNLEDAKSFVKLIKKYNYYEGAFFVYDVPKFENILEVPSDNISTNEDGYVAINSGSYKYNNAYDLYTYREISLIKREIDALLKGIEIPQKGDKYQELNTFREICVRLAKKISYDYSEVQGKKGGFGRSSTSRNLYGGLVENTCVCTGYAQILKNVLSCVGIECVVEAGCPDEEGSGHAWNMVKIGGKWFNIDLTNECNNILENPEFDIRKALKNDEVFECKKKYPLDVYEKIYYMWGNSLKKGRKEIHCSTDPMEFFEDRKASKKQLGAMIKSWAVTKKITLEELKNIGTTLVTTLSRITGRETIEKCDYEMENIEDEIDEE